MYTDEQLVARYVEVRDFLKKRGAELQEAVAAELGPANEALKAVGAELHRRLLERRQPGSKKASSSTDAGTFFLSESLHASVKDRAAFLAYVLETQQTDMLTNAVSTVAVEAYIEANQRNPPGVETEWVEKINVRRK